MTAINYVSQKEMQKKTGLKGALGYSFPGEDKILIRKGLTTAKKKEVLAHEEEHIAKGEEGPFLGTLLTIGSTLLGAGIGADAQKDAARTAAAGSERDLQFQRESRDLARSDQAPYREAGYTALDALMSMTGLKGTGGGRQPTAGPAFSDSGMGGPPAIRNRPGRSDFSSYGGQDTFRNVRQSGMNPAERRWILDDPNFQPRYNGGPMGGGQMYNINELGPENVYANGGLTRNPNPMTVGGQNGYVQPNIQGRALGGSMGYFREDQRLPGGTQTTQQRPPQGGSTQPPQTTQPQGPNPGTAAGGVMENPGGVEGGYNFMTDPGYNFRFDEGMRGLERSAAARGGLLSGGFGRKAIRYGQDYASNEYSNVYNRISNIAGLGQVANNQSGQYAMMAGQGMGNAASNAANATAYGQVGAGNAWANAGNQIAQMPWDQIFGGKP